MYPIVDAKRKTTIVAVYFGDTHANFQHMKWEFGQSRNRTIIHVGDFGTDVFRDEAMANEIFDGLNEALVRRGNIAYINRGNHDNPRFWKEDCWDRPNMAFVRDYSVLNIEGKMTLFLGGAISVDRLSLPKNRYFTDEGFNFDQERIDWIMEHIRQIDVVVSHTAPEFCFPISFNELVYHYAKDDPKLLRELPEERKKLGDVYRILNTKFKIKRWVYGHFHIGNTMHYNETEFTCMGINSHSRNQY